MVESPLSFFSQLDQNVFFTDPSKEPTLEPIGVSSIQGVTDPLASIEAPYPEPSFSGAMSAKAPSSEPSVFGAKSAEAPSSEPSVFGAKSAAAFSGAKSA